MKEKPRLIVMLTYQDQTVEDAYERFEQCKDLDVQLWGFKEKPLPKDKMKRLIAYMKECGKTTALEVVAYTEQEGLDGAKLAAECGCDILMGTIFFDSVNEFCKSAGIKYMPFVGKITGRPSVLEGSAEDMIAQANDCISKGAAGIDLLGYRYTGDAAQLNRKFAAEVDAPVCIAGSVNSYRRLDEIKEISPWAFTIGSAFFDSEFGTGFREQIIAVSEYMKK